MYTSCGQRLLQVGNDAVVGVGAACVSFGSSGLSIELGLGLINVLVRHPQPTQSPAPSIMRLKLVLLRTSIAWESASTGLSRSVKEAVVVMPQVDGCSKLAAQQYLGAGPFYLYLGTACSAGDCPGEPFPLYAKVQRTFP